MDLKQDEPALARLSEQLGLPLRFFGAEASPGSVPNPSSVVEAEIGTPSVAEAAALLGAHDSGASAAALVLEKQKFGIGTLALARAKAAILRLSARRAAGCG